MELSSPLAHATSPAVTRFVTSVTCEVVVKGRFLVSLAPSTPPPASRMFRLRSRNIILNLTQMVGHCSQVLGINPGFRPDQLQPPGNRPDRAAACSCPGE